MADETNTKETKQTQETQETEGKGDESKETKGSEESQEGTDTQDGKKEEEEGKKSDEGYLSRSKKKTEKATDEIPEPAKPLEVPEKLKREKDEDTLQEVLKAHKSLETTLGSNKKLPENYEAPFSPLMDEELYGESAFKDLAQSGTTGEIAKILEKHKAPEGLVNDIATALVKNFDDVINAEKQSDEEESKVLGGTYDEQQKVIENYTDLMYALPVSEEVKQELNRIADKDGRFMLAMITMVAQMNGGNVSHEVTAAKSLAGDLPPSEAELDSMAQSVSDGLLDKKVYEAAQAKRDEWVEKQARQNRTDTKSGLLAPLR